MGGRPVRLDAASRRLVLATIREASGRQGWTLYAAHVRTNHVHIVIGAEIMPEQVLGKLKTLTSRTLNDALGYQRLRWSRHGSTRWLWEPSHVDEAVRYVIHQQGAPMAVYENVDRWAL
jgi:REP element-mobilizing transposase RayT